MAIKWRDLFIVSSSAAGTYADPYGWNESGSWSDGDVCRTKAKTISSILEAGTDTVHITNTYRSQLTVQGTQNLTYNQYDVLYFPDYGTFWKITSSVSGAVLTSGNNNYIPVPVRNNTDITVQKVDMSIFTGTSTSTSVYVGSGNGNAYAPTTDGWTSETTQVTDGTAVSILNPQSTSQNNNLYLSSGGTTSNYGANGTLYPTQSTEDYTEIDCLNTVILSHNSTSSSAGMTPYGLCLRTLKLRQLFNGGSIYANTYLFAPDENITVDITHLISYNPHALFRLTFLSDQEYRTNITFETTKKTLTGNFDYIYSYQHSPVGGERTYYGNGKNNNLDVTIGQVWSYTYPRKLFCFANFHNVTIDLGPVYHNSSSGGLDELYLAWNITGTVSITYTNFKIEDSSLNNNTTINWHGTLEEGTSYSLRKPSGHKIAPTSLFPLPTGFTATNASIRPYAYNYETSQMKTEIYTPSISSLSQPYVVDIPIAQPATLSSDYRFPTNTSTHSTIYKFTDGLIMMTPQASSLQTAYNRQCRYWPYLTPDTGTVRTTGKSLKWKLDNYSSSYHVLGPTTQRFRTHSMYPLYVPVLSGTSYTFTGYLRTDRSGMATGDAWLDVFNSDETFVSKTNFTSSAYNAWEAVSVTFSAAEDGFARFIFKAIWNGSNQNYWIDDVEIS